MDQAVSGTFERRKNNEIHKLYNTSNICQFIRRLRELVVRVWRAEGRLIKKVIIEKPSGKRPLGDGLTRKGI